MDTNVFPSGVIYNEYYLYSQKAWEMAPVGSTFYELENKVQQNAPIVVTSSGWETTSSSDPWAQLDGSGKYIKRGFGRFTTISDGSYDTSKYEFSLHPDSSGKIMFNKALTENVFIEYEAGPSGYYILDSLDLNPVRNEFDSGFLHHSQITDPAYLYLMVTQSTVYADGFQNVKSIATLFDEDYDRIPEKQIIFELVTTQGDWSELGYLQPTSSNGSVYELDASGYAYSVIETTSRKGEAMVKYIPHAKKTGIQTIKAYYSGVSGIYDLVQVAQYYYSAEPFVLDLSLLDTLDYLT